MRQLEIGHVPAYFNGKGCFLQRRYFKRTRKPVADPIFEINGGAEALNFPNADGR